MREGFLHKLLEPVGVPIQDYRPAILYLNGEYWGIQNIRERYDRYYFERKYGLPEGELDQLSNNMFVEEGSTVHYQACCSFWSKTPWR